jgi:hypothetical protein
MRWGIVLLQQDPSSVEQSRVFPTQLRVHSAQLGRVEFSIDGSIVCTSSKWIRLQNSTKHTVLPSWRTYLVWPQFSPLDQDQTIDFVCRDLK